MKLQLDGKQALVTGAAGFLGSHLTERLARAGARVTALDLYNAGGDRGHLADLPEDVQDKVEVVLSDVRDPFAMRSAVRGKDLVFHLAALVGIPYSYLAPQSYLETNVAGTLNVLEACRGEGVERIVHTSTSETYGTARYTPMDEDHPLRGQSPYAASKIAADSFAESYHLSFGLPISIIRPFNVYGPRQSSRAVIPTIITQAIAGDVVRLGSLSPRRDFTFVEDTVRAFLAVASSPQTVGRVTNVGYGMDISVGELVGVIGDVLGKRIEVVTDEQRLRPDASEVQRLLCDSSRARETCRWQPRVSLREGLARTVEWIASHLDRFDRETYDV